jgi:hypothetical protein
LPSPGPLAAALGQFNILERQVELVGSELFGLRAERLKAQLTEHAFESALCLLGLRQSRLEVRVFLGKNSVIHALIQLHNGALDGAVSLGCGKGGLSDGL